LVTIAVEVYLPDIEAAKEWIIKNQLGRRNLTEQEVSYYRGKLYESRKRQGARTDLTLGKNFLKLDTADDIGDRKSKDKNWPLKTTADEIEEEYTLIGLIRMKPFH